MKNLYLGLSGVVLPTPKYQFPEEYQSTTRLTYYASFFNSLEVNSTFYALPQMRTVAKWALEVPDDFAFTFKFSKSVSHHKECLYSDEEIVKFFRVIDFIGHKKACVLVQFPPGFKSSRHREFEMLLTTLTETNKDFGWRIAVEFRDSGWYNNSLFDLLHFNNVALVLQDMPKSTSPLVTTARDFVYVRFHGPTGNYRSSYTDAFLEEYAAYIKMWLSEKKTVFVYFNNTAGSAFQNLRTLQSFLKD